MENIKHIGNNHIQRTSCASFIYFGTSMPFKHHKQTFLVWEELCTSEMGIQKFSRGHACLPHFLPFYRIAMLSYGCNPTPFPLHIPDIVMFLDINFMKHHIFFFGIYVSFHLHGNVARQYRKQETLLWNQTDKPIKTPALPSIYNTNMSLFEDHASKMKLLFCDGNREPNVFPIKPALIKSSKIPFHLVNKQIMYGCPPVIVWMASWP